MLVKNPLDLNKDKYYRYQILVSSVMRYCVQFENYAIEIAPSDENLHNFHSVIFKLKQNISLKTLKIST